LSSRPESPRPMQARNVGICFFGSSSVFSVSSVVNDFLPCVVSPFPAFTPTQSGRPLCSLCGKPFSSSATSALPCPELRGERYP
jgi:hypothetical protein